MPGRSTPKERRPIASDKKAFPLRLDPQLYRALEQWANDELRSVNGHIEFLIREALRQAGRLPSRPAPQEQRDDWNEA